MGAVLTPDRSAINVNILSPTFRSFFATTSNVAKEPLTKVPFTAGLLDVTFSKTSSLISFVPSRGRVRVLSDFSVSPPAKTTSNVSFNGVMETYETPSDFLVLCSGEAQSQTWPSYSSSPLSSTYSQVSFPSLSCPSQSVVHATQSEKSGQNVFSASPIVTPERVNVAFSSSALNSTTSFVKLTSNCTFIIVDFSFTGTEFQHPYPLSDAPA